MQSVNFNETVLKHVLQFVCNVSSIQTCISLDLHMFSLLEMGVRSPHVIRNIKWEIEQNRVFLKLGKCWLIYQCQVTYIDGEQTYFWLLISMHTTTYMLLHIYEFWLAMLTNFDFRVQTKFETLENTRVLTLAASGSRLTKQSL